MKKFIKFFLPTTLMCLCFAFGSCSKEEGEESFYYPLV